MLLFITQGRSCVLHSGYAEVRGQHCEVHSLPQWTLMWNIGCHACGVSAYTHWSILPAQALKYLIGKKKVIKVKNNSSKKSILQLQKCPTLLNKFLLFIKVGLRFLTFATGSLEAGHKAEHYSRLLPSLLEVTHYTELDICQLVSLTISEPWSYVCVHSSLLPCVTVSFEIETFHSSGTSISRKISNSK